MDAATKEVDADDRAADGVPHLPRCRQTVSQVAMELETAVRRLGNQTVDERNTQNERNTRNHGSSGSYPPARLGMLLNQTFRSFDGTELFYRRWTVGDGQGAEDATPTRAVVLLHRGHEHSGRWQEFVERLGMSDTAVYAYDGAGMAVRPGNAVAPDFATLVKDADAFMRHISAVHGVNVRETAVVAHSVGAVVAAAWVHDYAPPIRVLVLATPALKIKLYVPLAIPSLRALSKVKKKAFIKSYVKAKMLTHDPEQAAAYDADSLISKQIAVNVLLDLHDVSKRLIADAGAIAAPTLVLGAGSDWVVKNSAAARFLKRRSSPTKEMVIFPGMGHAIFMRRNGRWWPTREAFIEGQFARPAEDRMEAVKGYTRREFEKLSKPSPACARRG